MADLDEYSWLKSKGYLHITAQIDVHHRKNELVSKVTNPNYISRYPFYPLLHTNLNERRYKRSNVAPFNRCHSYLDENSQVVKNNKSRPLHYATHLDAIIFGYYASILQRKYEEELIKHNILSDCVIAYRKIPSDIENKHKSTIHFAKEIFDEVKSRTLNEKECSVLTFDIKSFFSSLDHSQLKRAWEYILGVERLSDDHYNVFKAATKFSYIYLDELRVNASSLGRRSGFNEKELARIRNKKGIHAFFESPKSFREKVKDGSIKIYKFPFRNKETKEPIGIPQGLPISAVLANLYLLEFDKLILKTVVNTFGGFYRRYSDDIVVVCSSKNASMIEEFILTAIRKSNIEISVNKTERFLFKELIFGNKESRISSIKIDDKGEHINLPFNYLGFEFNGQKALIKSANLGKFYRRMIQAVKRKAKRARRKVENDPSSGLYIHRRQLYKLYTTKPLSNTKVRRRWKKIKRIENGEFRLITGIKKKELRSNYLTYVKRASEIMQEPGIENQIRKHKQIFNDAIHRHLKINSPVYPPK